MASTPFNRVCWKCGSQFARTTRHCPECGADSWNRPQGQAAALLKSPSAEAGNGVGISSHEMEALLHASRKSASGLMIVSTIAALGFWFWSAILAIGIVWEPSSSPFGDDGYLSTARVITAVFVAIVLTWITWIIAEKMAE